MNTSNQDQVFQVLLVEDVPGDARLTMEALKESKYITNFHIAEDGVKAIDFLNDRKQDAEKLPDLIFLDLNLPKKDGREVLAEIKQDDVLKKIPIVILTGSEKDQNLLKIYDLQPNCYVKKPDEIEEFIRSVKNIGDFWFSMIEK
jgi:CheY-like chemotaxis protein